MSRNEFHACDEYCRISRRDVLKGAAKLGLVASMPAWLPKVALADSQDSTRDIAICLFLRGGIDGLTLCVPFGDPNYYTIRPTLAVPEPDTASPFKAVNLDGFFGMSHTWAPLLPAYQDGKLLFVHATGAVAGQWTRSHFDAMRWMEVGKPGDLTTPTGWLGRHLDSMPPMTTNPQLRGISLTYGLVTALRGGPQTLPIPQPENFDFYGAWDSQPQIEDYLRRTYTNTSEPLKSRALDTMATVDLLRQIDFENYVPAGGAIYPDSEVGRAFKSTAALIRAEVGIEVAAIDAGGWDTHNDQGNLDGYMAGLMTDLARSLAAFYRDLSVAAVPRWTLVGMSEFGRVAKENGSRGTDHGTANAMFLMGPKVTGGRVLAQWPGLAPGQLFEGQDLAVTIDYRDILCEVVTKRLKNPNLSAVFPGYTPNYRGVVLA